jgi:hypothetical protein
MTSPFSLVWKNSQSTVVTFVLKLLLCLDYTGIISRTAAYIQATSSILRSPEFGDRAGLRERQSLGSL